MRRTVSVIAAGALLFLAGCSGDDAKSADPTAEDAAPASVTLAPADGATDVSPVDPLEISVTDGELAEVTVVDGDGTTVPGAVAESPDDPATEVWTPEAQLAYGTSYTLTAVATNAADDEATATTTFSTVSPTTLSTPSIGPLDGTTVGVGMPVRVYFDEPVTDKAAVESHLQVTTCAPLRVGFSVLPALIG